MMGLLLAWSQVFTFPAGKVAHLSVLWSVGKVTVEHREDTLFRVEIRKPDTLPDRVVLGEDTVAYDVRLEQGTLRVHMEGAEGGYRRKTGFIEGLRFAFGWLGWALGKQPRPTLPEADSIQVVITGPARPYDLVLRAGDATLRTPASGKATVNLGDLAVTGGDTARLVATVNMGDVEATRLREFALTLNMGDLTARSIGKLEAKLNMGDVDLEEIQEADVALNMGDLIATRVQNLSFSVNMGDIRVREGKRVRGSVDMGDVKVAGVPAESVRVTARMGKVWTRREKRP